MSSNAGTLIFSCADKLMPLYSNTRTYIRVFMSILDGGLKDKSIEFSMHREHSAKVFIAE